MGKFVIKKSSNGQFYFNLKAGNGEIIITSETYTTKSGAQSGIESTRTNSQIDGRYDRQTAANNQYYFVLRAANYEKIGRSEMYTSSSAMETGIASVKANAPSATVEDLS